MNNITSIKKIALLEFLRATAEEGVIETQNDRTFYHVDCEYLVLTDEEADEITKEYIENSLFGFVPDFIISNSDIIPDLTSTQHSSLKEAIKKIQNELCEDANEIIRAFVQDKEGNIDKFVKKAIEADGRGNFISTYDGEEYKITVDNIDFHIYKMG